MGVREGWADRIEKAYEAGLVRVPPQATRFVLAADMDFEFMEPTWEAAIADLSAKISMEQLAASRGGMLDTIEGLPAVALPNDTYVIQLGPKTLGAMGPGKAADGCTMDPRYTGHISHATAGLSGEAGRLFGHDGQRDHHGDRLGQVVLALERVVEYLKARQTLLDQWKADRQALAQLLSGVQGVRIGVRIDEEPSARIAVDLRGDASITQSYAKVRSCRCWPTGCVDR